MNLSQFLLVVLTVASISIAADGTKKGMRTTPTADSKIGERASATAPTTKPTAHDRAAVPNYPPAFDEATKDIDKFKIASGLKMTAWAADPQLANPVALWVDDQGRCWVAETFRFDGGGDGWGVYDIRHMYDRLDEDLASKTVDQRLEILKKWNKNDLHTLEEWPDRLRLIQDKDGDGKADQSTIFAEWASPLDGIASGVITRRRDDGTDDVYVANIPDLYLLRDTNNDGVADEQKSLSHGYGVRYSLLGHDLHGLRFGPDGRLYFSIGDRGMHVKTPDGKVLDYPDEGAVLRCDPDGSNLEVFARGLRNPQKLVFDQYGNLFTGDNNCDYGDPARWVYIVEGGDTGWRIGYQHLQTPRPTGPWLAEKLYMPLPDNTAAYINPPVAHIASGPSGCTYYPGVGLPEKYNEHFFLTDFRAGPSSVIHSFALKPKGAGFELVDRDTIVERVVATDIEFGPDCAAYITDWDAQWVKKGKGRIHRLAAPELEKSPLVLETKKLINEGMKSRKSPELATLLGHSDMRVRQAAQFELARRGSESIKTLTDVAKKSENRMARIHALWALGQIDRKSSGALQTVVVLLDDKDDEIRAQSAKVLGEAKIADAYERLIKLLDDPNLRVRYFAALGLGRIGRVEAVPAIAKMLAENADKDVYVRHAGAMALTWINDIGTLNALAKDQSSSVRLGALLAMRNLKKPEIAVFLPDSDPLLITEAARAINDAPIESAQPELAKLLGSVNLPEPAILRALHANYRLGGADNAVAVARFAARGDAPELMRIEALQELADWSKPRGIDRVTGNWRPLSERDAEIVVKAARPALPGIVTSAPDGVRLSAIKLIEKVGVDDPNVLFDLVAGKTVNPDVAAAALSAMESRKDPRLSDAIESALTTGKGSLRTKAISFLSTRDDAAVRLEKLLASGSIQDQQAVLTALATIDQPSAKQILSAQLDKLLAGTVAPELQLDLLEAAAKCKSDDLKAKAKAYDEKRKKDDPLSAFSESLVGGDASAGRKIFLERQDVSCLRCHKLDGTGGVAGPDLTGVGSRHERKYLLEAIVNPNAQIAPGFESVTVRVKAGKNYAGVVRSDTEKELIIDAGDGAVVTIDKKEVDSRTKGLSPMPQDIDKTLSKRDVRDLVEFLANLKAPTTATTQK